MRLFRRPASVDSNQRNKAQAGLPSHLVRPFKRESQKSRGYSGYYQVGSAAHLALAQPCPFQFESDGRVQ
ncbi:hypothetical protein SERLA73DRAFT_192220 [Serpula lacrymans var. lacrymans S7.3]|uniref:Uncharacterized protein n=1 Tax=Serpula lacrymans var. lacrymans (strain S7.3) TaxID=936435 RepID=F8QJC3_SERL3|nr:hypothetical protein SERLA73DRAFT_192220 [Serpula lacrymans var. lacrymans S7.3]